VSLEHLLLTIDVSAGQMKEIVKELDADGSGTITFMGHSFFFFFITLKPRVE